MNYAAYVRMVGGGLEEAGFRPEAVPEELQDRLALVVSRAEAWGRLLIALAAEPNRAGPGETEALVRACGAWMRAGQGEAARHMILVFPFDREVGEEEAEAIVALQERDPDDRWSVIPWCADLEVGLVDQHTGFPPVDPAVARILTEVPEEPSRPSVQHRPSYEVRRTWLGLDRFPATRVILALTVAYYLWTVWMSGGLLRLVSGPDTISLVLWGANYSLLTLGAQTQQWRLVSHLFLHGGAMHLAFNMWAFWHVGRYCELIFGSARMLFIYFVAGVAGGVASVALRPGLVVSVGASGAILGLMGALIYFATTVRNRRVDWQGLLAPVAINLLFGFVYGRVDNYAHIGGLVGGLLAAFIAGAPGERYGWRQVAAPVLGGLVLLLVTGILPLRHITTLLP